jgi:acyl dehydratase
MEFFEDVAVGARDEIGAFTFTAEEIKRFARSFDPQPFHLDEAAAARSHFGRLLASGWHTQAVWMKLNVRHWQRRVEEQKAARRQVAKVGPSPGFDELKWSKPVYAGDTITFVNEITGKRASRSMPGWGLVTFRMSGRNQNGEEAVSFIGHFFVERREKAEDIDRER